MDQATVDGAFCTLVSRAGTPLSPSDLLRSHHVPAVRRVPAVVQELFGEDYVDVSAAACDHGFTGVYVGVTDEVWDRAVSASSTSTADLECRLGMLMAALRVAAVEAMLTGQAVVSVWEPVGDSARRLELGVEFDRVDDHQVLLARIH